MFDFFGLSKQKGGDPKKDAELTRAYRNVFLDTHHGRKVLNHMLTELNLFDQGIDEQVDIARRNYAFRLLWLLGIWDGKNIKAVIDALAMVPVNTESQNEG